MGDAPARRIALVRGMALSATALACPTLAPEARWYIDEPSPDAGYDFIPNLERGDRRHDCEQGWEVDDYSLWMPLPAAPNQRGV